MTLSELCFGSKQRVAADLWLSDVTQGVTAGKTTKVHAAPFDEMSVVGEAVNVDNTNTVVGNPVTADKSTAPGGQTVATHNFYVQPVGRWVWGGKNGFASPIGCTAKAFGHGNYHFSAEKMIIWC